MNFVVVVTKSPQVGDFVYGRWGLVFLWFWCILKWVCPMLFLWRLEYVLDIYVTYPTGAGAFLAAKVYI